jgi:TRAP-type C4-dicarboxylate transport system substrate-binding protein
MKATLRYSTALVAASLALTACGSSSRSSSIKDQGTKVGGSAAPIAITIADSQAQGRPSNLPLDEFAAQVEALSNGSMKVTMSYEASADAPIPGSDQPVIDDLASGAFQMAVIPARAWSAAGVSSLRALQAPFLVQSDDQVNAIVREPSLVSDLLSGLDAIGVHGIMMFPESLRHFFSFTTPILTPSDAQGRQIRYVSAQDVADLISTLGATPVDPAFDDFEAGVDNGTITAADSGFVIALDSNPRVATATGNLVLYPKVITLAANAAFWNGLSDGQRQILTTASEKAQDYAINHRVTEADAAAAYCAGGGTVVVTDTKSLADFRTAANSVYDKLEQDPLAKRAISAIDALAKDSDAGAVAPCTPTIQAPTAAEIVPDGGALPDGIYRFEQTADYLRTFTTDASFIDAQAGTYTAKLSDGHWTFDSVTATSPTPYHEEGVYQVKDNVLYWNWVSPVVVPLRWSTDDDGTLHFEAVGGNYFEDLVAFGIPWTRIGDL